MSLLNRCSRAITVHRHFLLSSKNRPDSLFPFIRSSLYSTSYLLNPPQITNIPKTRKKKEPSSSSSPSTSSQKVKQQAEECDWPRPKEIPYQAKVANLVNLIGRVMLPVKSQSFRDGKHRAITFICQEFGERVFSIPVMFQGDLAHIAAFHLKKNDSVHVTGQLSEDPIPFPLTENLSNNYHVVVQDIEFVMGLGKNTVEIDSKKNIKRLVAGDIFHDGAEAGMLVRNETMESFSDKKSVISTTSLAEEVDESVRDKTKRKEILTNPQEKQVTRDQSGHVKLAFAITHKRENDSDSWQDVVINSKEWLDFREKKSKGLLTQKFPDFKHKDANTSLWLSSAPNWVLSELENLEFGANVPKQNKVIQGKDEVWKSKGKQGKDEIWKSLAENPNEWWDNRLGKKNEKGPDFKHKKTGEGLWLNTLPDWLLSKLPPLRQKQSVGAS